MNGKIDFVATNDNGLALERAARRGEKNNNTITRYEITWENSIFINKKNSSLVF